MKKKFWLYLLIIFLIILVNNFKVEAKQKLSNIYCVFYNDGEEQLYYPDQYFELKSVSQNEYNFKGWQEKQNDNYIGYYLIDKRDIYLYPRFELKQYHISYDLDGGELDNKITSYYSGEIINFGKPIKDGYKFICWKIDKIGKRDNTENIRQDISVKAIWEKIPEKPKSEKPQPEKSKPEKPKPKEVSYDLSVNRIYLGNYTAKLFRSHDQSICDDNDSACLMNYYGLLLIGDHNYQNFTEMITNDSGVIILDGKLLKIKRTGIYYGYIDTVLFFDDGTRITNKTISGDFIMYTCDYHRKDGVVITSWKIIN